MTDHNLIEDAMNDFVVGDAWDSLGDDPATPRTPPDIATASAIMRKLRALAQEKADIDRTVDAEIARLEAFRADATSGIVSELARGELAIEAFTRQWSPHSHKKTLDLPGGSGKLRGPGQGKLITHDAIAFQDWVMEIEDRGSGRAPDDPHTQEILIRHPDLVRVKVEPVADALKALTAITPLRDLIAPQSTENPMTLMLALPDGTVVPGVHLERATEDTFTLTIEGTK